MFFKKKEPTEKQLQQIVLNYCMLDSWRLDNGKGILSVEESTQVVSALMRKLGMDNLIHSHAEQLSALCATQADHVAYREVRRKAGFDNEVINFCENLGLPRALYK
jgi:hypothetical protein